MNDEKRLLERLVKMDGPVSRITERLRELKIEFTSWRDGNRFNWNVNGRSDYIYDFDRRTVSGGKPFSDFLIGELSEAIKSGEAGPGIILRDCDFIEFRNAENGKCEGCFWGDDEDLEFKDETELLKILSDVTGNGV